MSVEEATRDLLGEKQPSKKFTSCTDIGEYVAFLCSDAAANITGSLQVIDGGWTTQ
jgi:3-hydroxybutyrate dehydrogenase